MATVNVSTLDEFLAAITVSGDTVVCPENAEWNYGDRDPISSVIEIRCAEINGNGTAIIGLQYSGSGSAFSVYNSGDAGSDTYIHDLKLLEFRTYFTSNSGVKGFIRFYYNRSPVKFERVAASGIIYSNGNNDNNCFMIHNGWTIEIDKCAFQISFPSGGVFWESFCGSTSPKAEYTRFDITTTSSNSYGYNGYNPFVNRYEGFTLDTDASHCEIVIHAPNVERLELYKLRADYPTGYYGYQRFIDCVFRGELKSGAMISGIIDPGAAADRSCIFDSSMGTLDTRWSNQYGMVPIPKETMRDYDLLYAALSPITIFKLNFGIGETKWTTGDITINFGHPYIPCMIELPTIDTSPVPQNPYISVFDIGTRQHEFTGNGLAILTPSECTVDESLNGAWTFAMQHPLDAEGKWKDIKLRNLVRIAGQLFTILSVDVQFQNNSGYLSCSGEHIWYQIADGWIFPGDIISGATGAEFITNVKARTVTFGTDMSSMVYDFTGQSDIVPAAPIVKDCSEGCTPIDALIGSGGLVDQDDSGYAELYRDNFNFSINKRMENALDNAFDIRIGRDLRGIRRTFDTTQFVSYFGCYDRWGNYFAVSWVLNQFMARNFPHHIIRTKTFADDNLDVFEFGFAPLITKGMAFFRRNCKPIISYEIDLEDVRNNPDFSLVMHADRLKVGDSGTVYDERLGGKLTVRLSGTTYDAVRDKVIRITVGDQAHFSAPAASTVEIEPEVVGGELYIQDGDGMFIEDGDGKLIYQEVIGDA